MASLPLADAKPVTVQPVHLQNEDESTLLPLSTLIGRSSYCFLEGSLSLTAASPFRGLRKLVSGSKQRCQRGGFDLDLSYIPCEDGTRRMLALGLPATGMLEPLYRNPLWEVRAFLDKYHRNRYAVVNLCNERDYLDSDFPDAISVLRFRCDDHHAPPLLLILRFCEFVDLVLAANDENVVAVHCKAGIGRTGVMLSCYLMWSQTTGSIDADESLSRFRAARTSDGNAVTKPSQIRYVRHFASLARAPAQERAQMLVGRPVRVFAVVLSEAPWLLHTSCDADGLQPGLSRQSTVRVAAGAVFAALGGASTWALQLQISTLDVSDASDGASAHRHVLARSAPVQVAAGAFDVHFKLPAGGVAVCGEMELSLSSVGSIVLGEELLWLHMHTSFMPVDRTPVHALRTATFSKADVDLADTDPRFRPDWKLTVHYCYTDESSNGEQGSRPAQLSQP